MTSYASDTFTRANSATLGTSSSGHAWTSLLGSCGIVSNAAKVSTTGLHLHYLDSGQANGLVRGKLTTVDGDQGFCFRVTDASNYWYVATVGGTNIQVGKIVAGVLSVVLNPSGSAVPGDVIGVRLTGSTIKVFKNGAYLATGTDAFNQTATKHGLFGGSQNTTASWDDYTHDDGLGGAATHALVTTQPSNAQTGVAHGTQPIYTALDATNIIAETETGTVTASLITVTGSGTASGTLTKACVTGIADFAANGLTVTGAGTFKWRFTSSNGAIAVVDSSVFTVYGAVTQLVITAQPPALPNGTGASYPITPCRVEARDATNTLNPFYDTTHVLSATLNTVSGGPGVLTGPAATLFFSGVAVLRGLGVVGTGTYTYTLTTGEGGITSPTTSSFVVSAATDTFYPPLATTSPVHVALPRSVPNPAQPSTAGVPIYNVGSGQPYTTIQAALNAVTSRPARVILKNGNAFNQNVVIPVTSGTGYLTIEVETMPCAVGTRTDPSFYTTQATWTATAGPAVIGFANGANHVWIMGVRLAAPLGNTADIIETLLTPANLTGGIPDDIVVDRVYIQGNDTYYLTHGIYWQCTNGVVKDSYVANCHRNDNDSQAILIASGAGPHLIQNNYLEGESENLMVGGTGSPGAQYIPNDITIRYNLFKKPAAKKGVWTQAKNLFELKEGHRIEVYGNIFDGFWDAGITQRNAFNLKSVNQYADAPWTGTSDVYVHDNVIRNVGSVFALAGHPQGEVEIMSRVILDNNIAWNIDSATWSGYGRALELSGVNDVLLNHITFVGARPPGQTFPTAVWLSDSTTRTTLQNLLWIADGVGSLPITVNAGTGTMNGATSLDPAIQWRKNVVTAANGAAASQQAASPAGNVWLEDDGAGLAPDPGFADLAGARAIWETGDPLVVLDKLTLTSGAYRTIGVTPGNVADSTPVGARDIASIKSAIAGVYTPPSSPTATHLTLAVQPSAPISGTPHGTQPSGAVRDASNGVVTSDASTVTATLVVTSGTAQAIGTLTAPVVSGAWAFTNLGVISAQGATAHWHFTDGSLTAVDSASFTVAPRVRGRRIRV